MADGSKYAVVFNDGVVYPTLLKESKETLENECEKSRLKMFEIINLISSQNRLNIIEKSDSKGFFNLTNIEIVPMSMLNLFVQGGKFFNANDGQNLFFLFDDILQEHLDFEIIDMMFDDKMTFSDFSNSFSIDIKNSTIIPRDNSVLVLGIEPKFENKSDYHMFKSLCSHISVAYQGDYQIFQLDDSLQKKLIYLENHFLQEHKKNGVFVRQYLAQMGRVFKEKVKKTIYEKIILAQELVIVGNFPIGLLVLPEYETSLCEIKKIRYEPTSHLANLEARQFNCNYNVRLINYNSKIVIIELLGTKDSIRDSSDRAWESFMKLAGSFGFENVEKVNISSVDQLEEYLYEKSRDIDFLILSGHGTVDYDNGETYLVVGDTNEKWVPMHFEKFRFPPLVSISACFSGARSEKIGISVSDRILMNGAIGVISTLFTINPKMNALMHTKLLLHISEAIKNEKFVSITEIWDTVILVTLIDSIALSTKNMQNNFFHGGLCKKIIDESKRGKIERGTILSDLKRIIDESTNKSKESFIIHDNYFSESLCYQLIGNTDIIFAGNMGYPSSRSSSHRSLTQ